MNTLSKLGLALLLGTCVTTVQAAGDPVAGKKKAEVCVACHGADGNSENPLYPRLAGQYADYIVRSLEDYATGARNNAIMAGFSANLSAEDRNDLAAWFARQRNGLHSIKY